MNLADHIKARAILGSGGGEAGPAGEDGADGAVGPAGPAGADGPAGVDGASFLKNTTAPNATVPVAYLLPVDAATNVDVALSPKGTGAKTAHVSNGAVAGGNKRGIYAVDWQSLRLLVAQVASGAHSVIGGGQSNTASGANSFVGGGQANQANNWYASVIGGHENKAPASYSSVGGGYLNTADRDYSCVPGGRNAKTRVTGSLAFSSGQISKQADNQFGLYALKCLTTDATPGFLVSSFGDPGAYQANSLQPDYNGVCVFKGQVVARQTTTGDVSLWDISGIVRKAVVDAEVAFLGTPVVTMVAQDAGAASWNVALSLSTAQGVVAITVTGEAAKTIRWMGTFQTMELSA